jgi:hypothetical protein
MASPPSKKVHITPGARRLQDELEWLWRVSGRA